MKIKKDAYDKFMLCNLCHGEIFLLDCINSMLVRVVPPLPTIPTFNSIFLFLFSFSFFLSYLSRMISTLLDIQ